MTSVISFQPTWVAIRDGLRPMWNLSTWTSGSAQCPSQTDALGLWRSVSLGFLPSDFPLPFFATLPGRRLPAVPVCSSLARSSFAEFFSGVSL